MLITRDVIDGYFREQTSLPQVSILTQDGFIYLADWSERQAWWTDFARSQGLEMNWRTSDMGDPYKFALTLFRFMIHRREG